jgi:hypothetical protein
MTISTGSKAFTLAQTGKSFVVGQQVVISNTASPTNWMAGTITAFTSGTGAITVNVALISGSGTSVTTWTISQCGPALACVLKSGDTMTGTLTISSGDLTVSNGSLSVTGGNFGLTRNGLAVVNQSVSDVQAVVRATRTGGAETDLNSTATFGEIRTGTNHPLILSTNGIERFRVGTANELGITGANYGAAGQALISGGSGAAPAWRTMPQLFSISASVAANAMTITLNPTIIDFRSATLTSGVPNTRVVGSAISITIPSGATLGTTSGQNSDIAVIAIDNAGTVELVVQNLEGNVDLSETEWMNTAAISSGATSKTVAYAINTRTGMPYRVVGYVRSVQTTAGLWASSPSLVRSAGGQDLVSMQSFGNGQTWFNQVGARSFGTTYWNPTKRPMMVIVESAATGGTTGNGYSVTATVNGFSFPLPFMVQGYSYGGGTFIVPPANSYSVAVGVTSNVNVWNELR